MSVNVYINIQKDIMDTRRTAPPSNDY